MKIEMPQSEIKLTGIQVKSEQAFIDLYSALARIERTCGIREVKISVEDCFFCPWVDYKYLSKRSEMANLLYELIQQHEGEINK
jgi:hypothetical protein